MLCNLLHVHYVILLLCLLCRIKAHEPNDTEINIHIYTEINVHIYIKLLSVFLYIFMLNHYVFYHESCYKLFKVTGSSSCHDRCQIMTFLWVAVTYVYDVFVEEVPCEI